MYKSIVLLICSVITCLGTNRWPDHDISTLKLLQIVHRHGDRAPVDFKTNDPYRSLEYWPEGIGELSTKGKYRMYKRGQFIREEYSAYLGDKYSPREVYARSSLSDRCIESVSSLLSGAYPPKPKVWQWNNDSDTDLGHLWQPFPIQTFMPREEDVVLTDEKPCAATDKEFFKILNRKVIKDYLVDNKELLDNLSKVTGDTIDDVSTASSLYGTLAIEIALDRYWTNVWTKEEELEVFKRLAPVEDLRYGNYFDSPVIQRLRAGGLIRELNDNLQKVVNNTNDKKLYVYATHDTHMAPLMAALQIFNGRQPPFGAALYLELHSSNEHNKTGHFVRIYYHNETAVNGEAPHPLRWGDCSALTDCPLDRYFNASQHMTYSDFDKECNQL